MMLSIFFFLLGLISPLCELIYMRDTVVDDKFFLEQSDHCLHKESMLEYLNTQSIIDKEEYGIIKDNLSYIKKSVRLRRLQQLNEYIPKLKGLYSNRRSLVEQNVEERRDEMVSLLNLIYQIRSIKKPAVDGYNFKRQLSLQDNVDVTYVYLDQLQIDIIRNDLLPNDELYNISLRLPCLKYPPEKDRLRQLADSKYFRISPHLMTTSTTTPPFDSQGNNSLYIPNDPFALSSSGYSQWHLFGPNDHLTVNKIHGSNLFKAWAQYRGESGGMVVAVVDSGCSLHPDLTENLCKQGEDCEGYDFGDDEVNPFTEPLKQVHGTPISGIIASVTNNFLMTAGICWKCKIMCLKAYNSRRDGLLSTATVRALDYILRKKVRISNHSYVGYSRSRAEMSAIEKLQRAGHLMVVAAGNGGCNIESRFPMNKDGCHEGGVPVLEIVPASYNYDNIISVGGTNMRGQKTSLSNWGPTTVDIMAPGADILVPYHILLAKSGVSLISGTSASSAIVSGAAALVWSSNPTLTNLEIKDIVLSTAYVIPELKKYSLTSGILDVAAAIKLANGIQEPIQSSKDMDQLKSYLSTHNLSKGSCNSLNSMLVCILYMIFFLFNNNFFDNKFLKSFL